MTKEKIRRLIVKLYEETGSSMLTDQTDADPEFIGLRLFDAPLAGFGAADDPLFAEYKKPGIVGPWHMSPGEWLPGAKTVISIFFPMSEEVKKANAAETEHASAPWLYARIEGQKYIEAFMKVFSARLEEKGARCCVPQSDPRWQCASGDEGIKGFDGLMTPETFGSSWSERHAAFVCGLGTFGLSKGIITKKGMAGRFGSLITDLLLDPDERPYAGLYDYCTRCGACARRCPAGAIDPVEGKKHPICKAWLDHSKEAFAPRYGCGLCQTNVPCESRAPGRQTGSRLCDPLFRKNDLG